MTAIKIFSSAWDTAPLQTAVTIIGATLLGVEILAFFALASILDLL